MENAPLVAQVMSYTLIAVGLLIGLAVAALWAALRAWAVQGHRAAPLWDCGFGDPPAWQPYGDPLAQYSSTSFAQPLRRVLGATLLGARDKVFMPRPGDVSPARITVTMADPANVWLLDPIARARALLSTAADRLHFITVRQALSLMVFVLIGLLVFIAAMEQL